VVVDVVDDDEAVSGDGVLKSDIASDIAFM